MDGLFNEHLIPDFSALVPVLLGGAVIGTTAVARTVSAAALLFSMPRIGYRLGRTARRPTRLSRT